MANSGRIETETRKNSKFYVNWQVASQNTSGNYTTLNWQAGLNISNSDKWYNNAIKLYNVVINGTTVYGGGTFSNLTTNGDHQLASGSIDIPHESDGNKYFGASLSGWLYGYSDTSGSGGDWLPTIPRYANITSFNVAQRDETSVAVNFGVDATIDYCQYSVNNGEWNPTGVSAESRSFNIGSLSANTTYNVKIRVKRADSQLWTESGNKSQTTYDYPKPTSINDFNIGDGATVRLDNPLGRNCTLELISNNDSSVIGTYSGTYSGDVNAEFKTADAIDKQYKSIPNSNSGTYYAKVTYSGHVKTKGNGTYTTKTAECSPTFTNFNVEDSNTDVVAVTGNNQIFVKGYSTLKVNIPSANKMTTQKYATPSSYALSCDTLNDNVNYSDNDINVVLGTIANSGTLRVNARAYDSRSNSALAYNDITVLDYAKPVINIVATRLNDFENETTVKVNGTYTRLTINNVDKNTINNVKYRYRETGGTWSSWTNITTTLNNGNYTCNDVILSLDNTKSFEFEVQVTDNIDSNTNGTSVDIGQAIFFVSSNKRTCYLNGEDIRLLPYPVGSIYMSIDSTNPSILFGGGTWVQIAKGHTLVGVDTNDTDFNTVEKTGGSKKHQHEYGFRYHSWYNQTVLEGGGNNVGLINYDSNNNKTTTGNGSNIATYNIKVPNNDATKDGGSYLFNMTAKTENVSNLPPYFTCYIWKRTA